MKLIVALLVVSLAVAAFAQGPPAGAAQAAQAAAAAQAAGATGGGRQGGFGNLLTLGLLTGNMGGDFTRDIMACSAMGINPIFCAGGGFM